MLTGKLSKAGAELCRAVLTLIILVLMISIFPITAAAKTVNLDNLVSCVEGGNTHAALISTDKDHKLLGKVTGGVIFNLPEHSDVTIRLVSTDGRAWVRSLGRTNMLKAVKAQYNIAFYDEDWNNVWQESNAIETGKSRDFFVGANIRHIQVWSSWDYNINTHYMHGVLVAPYIGWDGSV